MGAGDVGGLHFRQYDGRPHAKAVSRRGHGPARLRYRRYTEEARLRRLRHPVFPRQFNPAARRFQFPDIQARAPEGKDSQETHPAGRPGQHALADSTVPLGACSKRSARWPRDLSGLGDVLERNQSACCQGHHAGNHRCASRDARDVSQCRLHARICQFAGL